jgi:hypothetical protein
MSVTFILFFGWKETNRSPLLIILSLEAPARLHHASNRHCAVYTSNVGSKSPPFSPVREASDLQEGLNCTSSKHWDRDGLVEIIIAGRGRVGLL